MIHQSCGPKFFKFLFVHIPNQAYLKVKVVSFTEMIEQPNMPSCQLKSGKGLVK